MSTAAGSSMLKIGTLIPNSLESLVIASWYQWQQC